jgi:hypothetical protein
MALRWPRTTRSRRNSSKAWSSNDASPAFVHVRCRVAHCPLDLGIVSATPLHGVWLMRGLTPEKVTSGSVRDISVSSDGCRAALKMDFSSSVATRSYPVFVVTLC